MGGVFNHPKTPQLVTAEKDEEGAPRGPAVNGEAPILLWHGELLGVTEGASVRGLPPGPFQGSPNPDGFRELQQRRS